MCLDDGDFPISPNEDDTERDPFNFASEEETPPSTWTKDSDSDVEIVAVKPRIPAKWAKVEYNDSDDFSSDSEQDAEKSFESLKNPFKRDETVYFNDNKATPYLFKGKWDLDFDTRLQVLLLDVDKTKTCCRRPMNSMENACFVVDRDQLKNKDDWLVTDLGSFENRGSSAHVFVIMDDEIVTRRACKGTVADRSQLRWNEFMVRNVSERHRKYKDFRRTSTLVYKCNGQVLPLGMIHYFFEKEEHPISPHKHPRSGKSFIPTAPSTKAKLFQEATGRKGPARIFDEVSETVGGVLDCELSSDLPRDSKQVQNARHRATSKVREDEFASLLDLAKEDSDVHNLQWTPSPRVVIYLDEQLNDILRDCCSPDSTSILSIDTTFNIGNFYLTATTYQSKTVLSKKTGKPANLPGPAMFHTTKTGKDYLFFIQTLLESNYDLERLTFLGGDRDKAQSSFLKPLKGCTFLPCKKHVQDDIARKIVDLGLTPIKNELLDDIFGSESRMEKGIVDSESSEEFQAKVESVAAKWDKLEEDLTRSPPQFSRYFQRHIEDDMKAGMLLPVRRRAGLKDDFFYNNAQESSNAAFKSKIKEKKVVEGTGYSPELKCTWREAIGLYKEYVLHSRRCIQLSVLGKGPYTLSAPYKHLAVTDSKWSGMSRKERKRHLGKLGICHAEELECQDDSNKTPAENKQEVMGSFAKSDLPEFARGSWANANKILQLEGIVSFAKDANKQNVISLTRPISHIVEIVGKKFICSECPRYSESGICAHTLAVAYQVGKLAEYTQSYRVPLDKMVGSTIPIGTGKKENEKRARKRKTNPPRDISDYADRTAGPSNEETVSTPYHVVFISRTKATTCYACKGRVRNTPSDQPPPAPHDILLRHMERRVYNRRGQNIIRITTRPEAVYYHPLRSCVAAASSSNIEVEDAVLENLAESTKQLLWREFGIQL